MHIHTYLSHLIQIFFLSTPGKILHIPFWVLSPQIHKKKFKDMFLQLRIWIEPRQKRVVGVLKRTWQHESS